MRTRSASFASPFTTALASDDLLDHVLALLPPEALARVAFSSKRLAARVAVRAVMPSLWSKDEEVVDAASDLWSVANNGHFADIFNHRADDDDEHDDRIDFDAAKDKLVRLIKDNCALDALVSEIENAEPNMRFNGLFGRGKYAYDVVKRVENFQMAAMQHVASSVAFTMSPGALTEFAKGVTAAAPARFPKDISKYAVNAHANAWAGLWKAAVSSSFQRNEWTPNLIAKLAAVCPYPSTTLVPTLLNAITFSLDDLAIVVTSEGASAPEVSATLITQYVSRRFFELLRGEDEHVTYDEDTNEDLWESRYLDNDFCGAEGLEIKDRAKLLLRVLKRVAPPVSVTLHVIKQMGESDRTRHSNIEEDDRQSMQSSGEAWTTHYKKYLGSQLLLNGCFGKTFDFTALSAVDRKVLIEGLATFKPAEIRRTLLEFALGWIAQLVDPLKASRAGARAVVDDVQRICKVLSEKPKKAETEMEDDK